MSIKKTYHCFFPGCDYSTAHRSKIDFHHVTPRELDSSRRNKKTVSLCKNHHAMIYHPLAKNGQHSIQVEDSLQIIGIFDSTIGETIQYQKTTGEQFYYTPDAKKIWD